MIEKPKDGFENPEMYKKHERKFDICSMMSFIQVVEPWSDRGSLG